jgi:hypothetical protein
VEPSLMAVRDETMTANGKIRCVKKDGKELMSASLPTRVNSGQTKRSRIVVIGDDTGHILSLLS